MKHRAGKIILCGLLMVTVGVGLLYYKQQTMPIEIYVAPGKVSWQKWASAPVAVDSVESLDFDLITASIIFKRDLYQRIGRLHFTFAETANFELLARVFNNYAQAGGSPVSWRIEGTAETLYELPGTGDREMIDWFSEFGSEDLALASRLGKTACLLQIMVTPDGLWLNDERLTDEELAKAIATIIGSERVDYRGVLIWADPAAPLRVANGLFGMIAADSWHYQIGLMDPEETTYQAFTAGAGAEAITNRRAKRLRRSLIQRKP